MIGIGSMALLGAISFAPVFAQQGGQQGQQRGQRQGQQGGMGQTGQLRVGSEAPDLNLFGLKGQVFVLEFINPTDQKWVKLHEEGKLKETYQRYKEQGIVWLAIAPFKGQQGGMQGQAGQTGEIQGIAKMDRQQLMQAVKRLNLDFPILYDEGGKVSKTFGIDHVPHLVVVDGQSKIAYAAPITEQGGQVAGLDRFERALGQAIQTQESGSLPAGAPRTGQQGQQGQQGQDRERMQREQRERMERERNQQNRPR